MADFVTVIYEGSEMQIESLGPHTILGVVEDALKGTIGPAGDKAQRIVIDIDMDRPTVGPMASVGVGNASGG
jgi:hypothetical protein